MSELRERAIDALMDLNYGDYWKQWGNPDSGWLPQYVKSTRHTLERARFVLGRQVDAVLAVVDAQNDARDADSALGPDDGYPSREELQRIREFRGSPREFVEYVGSVWRNGAGWSLEQVDGEFGGTEWLARFITGGWSGCETVIGVVQQTMFSFAFHSLWQRGGLFEYRISDALIDADGEWGEVSRAPDGC